MWHSRIVGGSPSFISRSGTNIFLVQVRISFDWRVAWRRWLGQTISTMGQPSRKQRGSHGTAGLADKSHASSAKSAFKREQIIRAATQIINEKSFAQATMTEIAAALDLRDATLYYYFSNKQALGYACHISSLERIEHILLGAYDSESTGAQRLRRAIHQIILDGEQHGSQLYFGDNSYLSDEQRNHVDAWSARLEAMIEQILVQGVRDRSIVSCETRLVTKLLIGMLISLARWTWRVEGMTADRLMEAIGVASLRGLESGERSIPR